MQTKTPTDVDRKAAVALADAVGIEEAAGRTGWSKNAITRWSSSDKYRSHTRAEVDFTAENWAEQLTRTLQAVALIAAERELVLSPLADISLANKVRTTAVHDVQLLTGKATERTDSVEVTASEAQSLADELAARRAKSQKSPAAEGVAV